MLFEYQLSCLDIDIDNLTLTLNTAVQKLMYLHFFSAV